MTRVLFWLALAVLVVFAIRSKLRAAARVPPAPARRDVREARVEAPAESMTACAHCGIHFPASEAVQADGRDYCSPAHVRLPPR